MPNGAVDMVNNNDTFKPQTLFLTAKVVLHWEVLTQLLQVFAMQILF